MVLDKTSQQRGNIPEYIRNLMVVNFFMSTEGQCEIKCKVGSNKSNSLVAVNVKFQNTTSCVVRLLEGPLNTNFG